MSTEIIEIVNANPHFEILENGKLRCKLTNHEMNPDLAKYDEYIKSKGYQKAIEKNFDFDQYKPHIVPFKGQEDNFLWCHLTKTKVPKMKAVILRHVEGKKYIRLVKLFNQKKNEREEKKRVTLLKCKVLTKEEDDDKFDERYIDRMLMEFEEDERLNDQDLDGEESYSDDLYQKVHANSIFDEDNKKKDKKQNGQKPSQLQEGEEDEELGSGEEDLDEEEIDEEEEGDQNGDVENEEDEELEIPDQKEDINKNNANKFQHNSKKFNGDHQPKNQNGKQGFNKKIKKNKQNNNNNHFNHNNKNHNNHHNKFNNKNKQQKQ